MKTLIGNPNVLVANILVYQFFVEKVHTYLLLGNASILQVLNEALTEKRFAIIVSSSNFNDKKPFKDLDQDVKKLNNIKTNWRKYSDRQKNGSSLPPKKLPKWFDITNPLLSDKNQGLDNIVSCPKDTSILNAAEDSD